MNILKSNQNNLCGPILMHVLALLSRSAAYTYGWVPYIMAGFLISWLGSSYHGRVPHIMAGFLILWLGSSYYGWVPHIMAWFLILWLGSSY